MKKLVSKKGENQMLFKRMFLPMVVVGILLALSSTAFAQGPTVDCQLSVPLQATARGASTGLTEPPAAAPDGQAGGAPGGGTLTVTCTNSAANPAITAQVAVLTIAFGATITNSTGHPNPTNLAAPNVRLDGCGVPAANVFAVCNTSLTTPGGQGPGVPQVSGSSGLVSIVVSSTGLTSGGSITWAPGASGTFNLKGVLIALNGLSSTKIQATLSVTPGSGYSTSNNIQDVISNILTPIASGGVTIPATLPSAVANLLPAPPAGQTHGGTANVNNIPGAAQDTTFAVRIEENYQDLFRFGAQFNGGGTFPSPTVSGTQVEVRFTGIPALITLGGCGVTISDVNGNPTSGAPVLSSTAVTQTAPTLTIAFTTGPPLGAVDVLWVACTQVVIGAGAVLPSTPITIQATMSPTGNALSSTGGVLTSVTTGQIPRYAASLVPTTALAVVNFPPAAGALLIPFGSVGGGYNTGIAISNTTTDVLGNPSVATPQNGTITYTFFDVSGTVKSYTTSASSPTGNGGLAGGILNSGKTYAVNLSDLLAAAGMPSTFSGYIFVQTNFTHAHGAAYIYNANPLNLFFSATPILVVTTRAVPESLGQ
jgi:hypothetical protein